MSLLRTHVNEAEHEPAEISVCKIDLQVQILFQTELVKQNFANHSIQLFLVI